LAIREGTLFDKASDIQGVVEVRQVSEVTPEDAAVERADAEENEDGLY